MMPVAFAADLESVGDSFPVDDAGNPGSWGVRRMSVKDALSGLVDRRVKCIRPLIPPQIIQEDIPL